MAQLFDETFAMWPAALKRAVEGWRRKYGITAIPGEDAAFLLGTLDRDGFHQVFDEAVCRIMERGLLSEEKARQRSRKGAEGQQAAAMERQARYVEAARLLISERMFPFSSYRALGKAVAKHLGEPPSAERAIRKHLGDARLLPVKNSG